MVLNLPNRCVDGRQPKTDNPSFMGVQFPGGSLGILDVLRLTTGLEELPAREVMVAVYQRQGWQLGDHSDDHHGDLGCGDQKAKSQGKLPMFKSLSHNEQLIKDRISWITQQGGAMVTLSGEHQEKGAAVNLEFNTTYNTTQAVKAGGSLFNCDLWAAYVIAGYLYDELEAKNIDHHGPKDKQVFQTTFTQELLRNYLQTLKALGQEKNIYLHG